MRFLLRNVLSVVAAAALLVSTSSDARATDGHFLHGVGAVQSAMGGAGTAAATDVLGALYLNPAALMAFDGTRVELGFEMFKPARTVSSSFGSFSGSTDSKTDYVAIPAFGWSTKLNNEKIVLALGGLGIGGFGVDYPQDNTNPILGPRPSGFGQVFSNYTLLKVTMAAAWAVTPKFWVGGALNVDWATLTVDPAPFAAPDVSFGEDGQPGTPDDQAFYSRATATDGTWGAGFQLGLFYEFNDMFSAGLSYTSQQWFDDFEWNAMYENPNNTETFGQARVLQFGLDVPAVASGGIAVQALPNLLLTGDARYIFYENTPGFDQQGFNADGSVKGFGWKNIWVFAGGLEWRPMEKLALRGGYNYSQNPIPDSQSFFNIPAPAIVQHHATVGLGFLVTRRISIDLAYYKAFSNSITGPFVFPQGEIPQTSVTNELSESSILLAFRFATRGSL